MEKKEKLTKGKRKNEKQKKKNKEGKKENRRGRDQYVDHRLIMFMIVSNTTVYI